MSDLGMWGEGEYRAPKPGDTFTRREMRPWWAFWRAPVTVRRYVVTRVSTALIEYEPA